ncbi:plasma-membrane proton-efflux P-type ATPase [Longilinea arvoryzae]|uniref:Plasma-membrane proton-efflux P-type ATPase n=1 Tax=Longilinea arvoryzae TaxID=360412 RepID=A0A0S7BDH8_9CHLR|nr:plasma-membrane proton-efflux P-type ATPase [Longilinea arvoryzae]GAP12515.1 plasma-membrane proton-efflux P-type ATPase [Longilinea arvoryzae]
MNSSILSDGLPEKRTENPSTSLGAGLSQAEAEKRLQQYGPNALPEQKTHLWLVFLKKMWGPIPWMLEACVVLELILGKYIEAGIIGALILFNAGMSTQQENNAQNALALLKKRLTVNARVLRDGAWQLLPSVDLVPGDVIYLRMGDLVPADAKVVSGQISLDQSSLTGESMAVEAAESALTYEGTIVVRGEATAIVSETGIRTRFGKTAELVRVARSTGQLEKIVFSIARHLVILDIILVAIVLAYAVFSGLPMQDMLPFALILLVASVPVALPATFTVATALGAVTLSKNGVLVTRLSSIEEAASMQVLCTDKTGTLTENKLEVSEIIAFSPNSQQDVIHLAVMASDAATQDPLDKAILEKAKKAGVDLHINDSRQRFVPFEPATKRSEAFFNQNDHILRIMKGAPQIISTFDSNLDEKFTQLVDGLSSKGLRVLAIASGTDDIVQVAGLVAFQDPPRPDSANLISRLKKLGIRVIMITGDGLITAKSIASIIGIGDRASLGESLQIPQTGSDEDYDVYAEVLPEMKYQLVKKFQKKGMVVGMTGDGVNDAPALKQAEVGVAVSSATDVAKAAASLVLTSPGLSNLVAAIETSRRIYQRMLTYTLNKIIKTIEIVFFLSFGLIFFHTFVTTPLLMILLIFTNDFVTMSISTDQVKPSPLPNRWNVRSIVWGAVCIALPILALSFGIFWYAHSVLQLPLANLQTLLFVMLVYSGQGTIYLVRERGHFWLSLPSKWMLIGTSADILVVGLLATQGILMAPIQIMLVVEVFGVICVYLMALDLIKVPIFAKLHLN